MVLCSSLLSFGAKCCLLERRKVLKSESRSIFSEHSFLFLFFLKHNLNFSYASVCISVKQQRG